MNATGAQPEPSLSELLREISDLYTRIQADGEREPQDSYELHQRRIQLRELLSRYQHDWDSDRDNSDLYAELGQLRAIADRARRNRTAVPPGVNTRIIKLTTILADRAVEGDPSNA